MVGVLFGIRLMGKVSNAKQGNKPRAAKLINGISKQVEKVLLEGKAPRGVGLM